MEFIVVTMVRIASSGGVVMMRASEMGRHGVPLVDSRRDVDCCVVVVSALSLVQIVDVFLGVKIGRAVYVVISGDKWM